MAEKEKIAKMTEFRGWLQKRIEELETEIEKISAKKSKEVS